MTNIFINFSSGCCNYWYMRLYCKSAITTQRLPEGPYAVSAKYFLLLKLPKSKIMVKSYSQKYQIPVNFDRHCTYHRRWLHRDTEMPNPAGSSPRNYRNSAKN